MATKKTATQKVMSKEELKEKLVAEKAAKTSAKKPVEKALKVAKKAAKKAEPQVEEKPKKQVAKTAAKKPAAKKVEPKENPMDKFFPATIEVDGTEFERHEEIASWEEFKNFCEAMQNAGTHVVIACNWPKKFKKYYNENNNGEKLFPKDGFKYDLDLQEVFMFQQTRDTVITVSVLTESVVLFREDYFEMTDFGYFFENGMPFMVYTYTDDEEAE